MKTINLSAHPSVLNSYIAELRNIHIQKDPLRFRRNVERIGEMMAYEMSKYFEYQTQDIQTPLGTASCEVLDEPLVLSTILRAGLPLHQGFLNVFDRAENAFISAYRKYKEKHQFDIHIEYISSPILDGKTLVLVDPMLASGLSLELAYKALLTKGKPKQVHVATIIAAQKGLDYIQQVFRDEELTLWVGAVDPILNEHSYIVPGLGDAGDLAFGIKD